MTAPATPPRAGTRAAAGPPAAGPPSPRHRPGLSAGAALYRLVLRHQVTTARLLLLAALGAVAVLVAAVLSTQSPDAVQSTTRFINGFGLGLMVPVGSLMLASAALGDPVEDQTLVYLWLRPTPRWILATAAWAATLTTTLPLLVGPLTVAALVGSGDGGVVAGTALATALGVLAYTGLFTLVGLVIRRSLLWGLVYVFIWEFIVARAGPGAARLSVNSYLGSILSDLSGVSLPLADRHPVFSVAVPAAVAVIAVALTAWRLDRVEVA
jgi:ABC-2 type transport system permease protein